MEKIIDLHMHSHYSEGAYSCPELIRLATKYNLSAISLTDHNVLEGNEEMRSLCQKAGIRHLAGVEIYTHHQGTSLHLLGYGFQLGKSPLAEAMAETQAVHHGQVVHSMDQLRSQGFNIDADSLFSGPSKYLGVVHLMKELEKNTDNIKKIKKEMPDKHQDYFAKIANYFGYGKPAHLPHAELPTTEAIDIINQSGGFASLAHPGQQLTYEQDDVIRSLVKKGLAAIEVLSPYHNWHQIEHYQLLAKELGLKISGGSDFHCDQPDGSLISRQWDYYKVPEKILKNLS